MKLHRTNINLYEEDVKFLESYHGYGWSNQVRDIVHDRVKALQTEAQKEPKDEWRLNLKRY